MGLIIDMLITSSKEPIVKKNTDGTYDVRVFDPETSDLLRGLEPYEVVSHFDTEKILNEIDEDEARKYFGFMGKSDQWSYEGEIETLKAEIESLKGMQKANVVESGKEYIDFTETKIQ